MTTVFLNIPLLRQIFGFFYLSFIPGALTLDVLKFNSRDKLSFMLYSVGLSIAFVMFVGLFVNQLYPVLGISTPLSTLPLVVTIGTLLLAMSFAAQKRAGSARSSLSFSFTSLRQFVGILLLFSLPFLAVFGAMYSSSLLLFALITSLVFLVAVSFFSRILPSQLKPIVILIIAISLLFQIQFLSPHLIGYDVYEEFYVFRLTQTNSVWNPNLPSLTIETNSYDGMLSVTILPTVYSNLLNLDSEFVFKVLYSLFYVLVPVAMYEMYKRPFGASVAFLAAFYFVLFPRFYQEERRQIIGELFLVLLASVILQSERVIKDMSTRKKQFGHTFLLIVFAAALVVSHYSIYYIFVGCILFAWFLPPVLEKLARALRSNRLGMKSEKVVTSRFLFLVLVFGVSWYFFVSQTTGGNFLLTLRQLAQGFTTDFFNMRARGGTVSDFVSPNLNTISWVSQMDVIINKVPYILIIVGFVAIVYKFRRMSLGYEYLGILFANMTLLVMTFVIPAFAPAFLPQRFYHVSLLFLAPICIFGGVTLLGLILRPFKSIKRKSSLILRILCIFFIVVFLFKVGFVSEVANDTPVNKLVSFNRIKASNDSAVFAYLYEAYSPEEDVRSAVWLSGFKGSKSTVYGDYTALKHVVAAYGMIAFNWTNTLNNDTVIGSNSYVYLRFLNLKGLVDVDGAITNATGVLAKLGPMDKIYSNGNSEIYWSSPN